MNNLPNSKFKIRNSKFAPRNQRSPRLWLLLILLGAFALRLYRLGVASLWYDETVSLVLAQKDLLALTRHTAGDIHPPLYYYLLHFWGHLAGWSEFSAAFLSLFFGVLLIALVYRVARDLLPTPVPSPVVRGRGEGVGVLAAFLVAISPYNLWYSQEVRMYTLGATLGLASVLFFVRMLTSHKSQVAGFTFHVSPLRLRSGQGFRFQVSPDFVAYAVVSALGLYTLYYFGFLLVFENLVALVWLIRKSEIGNRKSQSRFTFHVLRMWLASQLTIALLYAPWIPIALRQATNPPVPPWRSFTPLPTVLLESFSALALGQSIDPMLALPVLLTVAAVIVIALLLADRQQTTDSRLTTDHCSLFTAHCSLLTGTFLLAYTFIPLLLIYTLSLWKPLYHVRYIFTYSPGFYLLLALGLERLRNTQHATRIAYFVFRSILVPLIVASVYSAYNFWFNPRYADDDLRGAVQRIATLWRPGDAVLINAGYTYTAFVYYYDQPIAWDGRLTEYAIRNTKYATRNTNDSAIVLQTGSIGGGPSLGWGSPESDFYATTAEETRAALDRVFAAHPRVWMLRLYDTVVDPDGVIRDYLATRGRIIDDEGFAGESYARVQGYLTTRAPLTGLPASATHREVLLGNRIALLGFEPATATVRAGAPLDVTLYWQAREPTNVDVHLFIGLFAGDGTLVASTDELPLGNALGTSRWTPGEIMREPVRLRVPASIALGDYVLRVAMYDPFTKEPLVADAGTWIVEDSQIKLMDVRVE